MPPPQAPSAARLEVDEIVLALADNLDAVASAWRDFEPQSDHTFFQSFAWLDAWQRHVGKRAGVVPLVVTCRHPDGRMLCVFPLALHRRAGVRRLTFLGAELCDYNAPLLDRAYGELLDEAATVALWQRILKLVRADRRYGFDIIDLPKMPVTVGEQRNPLAALDTRPNPSGAYLTELTGSWDEFYARKRSSATRRKERKQLRQLGEFGTVTFTDRLEGQERFETLDVLFEQKARSFARMGIGNIFARPGHRELFTAFATEDQSRHLVHLSRLEIGSTIAAVSIGLLAGSSYSLVVSSYDDGPVARLGPGRAHLHELLRFALRNGFRYFDFTIGDEAYKQDWSDARQTLHDHVAAASWRGAVVVWLFLRFRATKRMIKQNPVMWRLFSEARSRLGAIRTKGSGPTLPGGEQASGDADD